jgi:alpha-tubulin suppressor-like RCC1 family protein
MHIDANGFVWGWGANYYGQLSQGDNVNKPTPQPVMLAPALGGAPVSVCAGGEHTCVLDSNKEVACTGKDYYGQVGAGGETQHMNVLTLAVGVSSIVHLGCGPTSVLATTTTGALMVWGKDDWAQLGRGIKANVVWEAVEVRFFYYFVRACGRSLVTVYW